MVSGTSPVGVTTSTSVSAITAVHVTTINANAGATTSVIIQDGSGATILTVPVAVTGALLSNFTGPCFILFSLAIPVAWSTTNSITCKLSTALASGSMAIVVGFSG